MLGHSGWPGQVCSSVGQCFVNSSGSCSMLFVHVNSKIWSVERDVVKRGGLGKVCTEPNQWTVVQEHSDLAR
jgi:hypothetical protein